jgi:photosystem II stability/assembly factor-like uncharacterized protein
LRGSYDELNDRRWPRIPNASVESEMKNQMLTRNVGGPKSSARAALALVAALPVFSQALASTSAHAGAGKRPDHAPQRSGGSAHSINPINSGCSTDGLLAMDPTEPNTLYLQYGDDYDGYQLRKSTDGGASWRFTGLRNLNALNALVIDPSTPATLYAATGSTSPEGDSVIGGVQQSTDGGATWNVVGLANKDVSLLAIDPFQPNVLYAVGTGPDSLSLFKSTDSGASWSRINSGLGDVVNTRAAVNALIADPDHPEVLYLGTSGFGVFKSSDGGATWAASNDGLTFLDARALAIVRGAAPTLYANTPGGVFKIRLGDRKGIQ